MEVLMESIEFQTWLSDLGRTFPAVREWLRSIKPEADCDALLDAWERALKNCTLDDCLAVNAGMLAGELDGPGEWPAQWQLLPAKIRRHASTLRWRREAETSELSVKEKYEDTRNLLVRTRRQAGIPDEQINVELVRAGYEPVAIMKKADAPNHN
jgi:hypothetical protein